MRKSNIQHPLPRRLPFPSKPKWNSRASISTNRVGKKKKNLLLCQNSTRYISSGQVSNIQHTFSVANKNMPYAVETFVSPLVSLIRPIIRQTDNLPRGSVIPVCATSTCRALQTRQSSDTNTMFCLRFFYAQKC